MPSWVVHDVALEDEPALSAADIEGARRVLATQPGWLVPAPEGELCLVRVVNPLVPEIHGQRLDPSVKRSCASRAEAEAGRLSESQSLSTTIEPRTRTRVTGIVPDGVRDVTIRYDGSASTSVAVVRNAYEAVLVNPTAVSFTTITGSRPRRHVIPLSNGAGRAGYGVS